MTKVKIRELTLIKDTVKTDFENKIYFTLRILFDDLKSLSIKTDDIWQIRKIVEDYLFVDKPFDDIIDITRLD